jgi:hypothetical protein
MRFAFRALILVTALAFSSAAFADSFSGTAVFNDLNNPNTNDVVFTGTFDHPSFNFSGGNGTVYPNFLTITASTTQGGNGQISGTDTLSIVLSFVLPDSQNNPMSGTGTITGHTNNAAGTISWDDTTILFADGSSLLAHLPTFSFSAADISSGKTAVVGGNLTLTVMTDGVPTTTATAPEPASLALMGTGVLAAASALRKRIKA